MTVTRGREDSTQFSLKQLLDLEDQRMEEVRREEHAAKATRARALAENAERQRAEAEAARSAAVEAEAKAKRAELDETARREAMQKAIVEQARLAVDVKARSEERELERRHELELQRLRAESAKGQALPLGGAALLGGAVILVVALGVHLGVLKPAESRLLAAEEQRVSAAESRAEAEGRRADEQRRIATALEQRLRTSDAELDRLRSAKPAPVTATPGVTVPGRSHVVVPPVARPAVKCQEGDPLCGTIGQ